MTPANDYASIALAFGTALVARRYAAAYGKTTSDYQRRVSLDHLLDREPALGATRSMLLGRRGGIRVVGDLAARHEPRREGGRAKRPPAARNRQRCSIGG